MTKISRSPHRHTFQKEKYLENCKENNTEPDGSYLEMFDKIIKDHRQMFDDEKKKNSLEYDLLTTDWILEKARFDEVYAQNLYASMCNNRFQKINIENTEDNTALILKNGPIDWSCSWRYAGGIIADMREEGDYINWYCSGISGGDEPEVYESNVDLKRKKYVPEGFVTEEIKADLKQLGWVVLTEEEEDF